MKKSIIRKVCLILFCLLITSSCLPVLAFDDETNYCDGGGDLPKSDTQHYYILKNIHYIQTDIDIAKYLTNAWQHTNMYTLTQSYSVTNTLTTTVSSGTFPLANVKSAAIDMGISTSYTGSYTVGTQIPADSSHYSKLVVLGEKEKYSANLYYVIDYGSSQSEYYQGSGYYNVPIDQYIEVIYQ